MKRNLLSAWLCVHGVGCALLTPPVAENKVVKSVETRPAFRPPVVAGHLNAANAQDKAKALEEELDRDLQAAIEARDQLK